MQFISDLNCRHSSCKPVRLLIIFSAACLFLLLSTCSKEENGEETKEVFIRGVLADISADSLRARAEWLQNMGTRFALAENRRDVAVRIRNRFRNMGFSDAKLDSFIITRTYRNINYIQTQYNVVAVIEGSGLSDSVCILGAHYDNITSEGNPFMAAPGAHDNASGVAAVAEVARVMKKHRFIPSRSIMFVAFAAEELGLFGSRHLAAYPGRFSSKISFMLNNDMIAYEPDPDPSTWVVNIIDYENSRSLRNDAGQLAMKYTALSHKNDNAHAKSSDSYPFFLNGYRSLFFYSGKEDPEYHSERDVASRLNFEYCREITKISCALLLDKN